MVFRHEILRRLWPNGATASELKEVFRHMNSNGPRLIFAELYENEYDPHISEGRLRLAKPPKQIGGKVGSEDRHIWKTSAENKKRGEQLWHDLLRLSS